MKAITECRACNSEQLVEFLDLGEQYLADFRKDDQRPPKYPLVAVFCKECKLVQLQHTTPQIEMYHERYGFKSGVNESIKRDLDDIVTHAFQYNNDPRKWLDIASNDGTLLSFVPKDIHRTGVDPVSFLCVEAERYADRIVNGFFGPEAFVEDYEINGAKYEKFDVITSVSCFYDMPDPNKFVTDVEKVLSKFGVWVIQQNYLLTTVELSAVDNFCHEHLEYYTLMSLETLLSKHGFEVNEVYLSPINGGSIRTIVSRKGTFSIDKSVYEQREKEELAGLGEIEAYNMFSQEVGKELDKLHRLVVRLHGEGKTIAILAASTRGATIWQSADIDSRYISYAVERNLNKVGSNFSQIGVPIISEEEFRKLQPDYAIIGPWFFAREIANREEEYVDNGGALIVPLPKLEILIKEHTYEDPGDIVTDLQAPALT